VIKEDIKKEIIQYWMEKAFEALESANSEYNAGRMSFTINRTYYASFYAASSVLMQLGKQFKKHTGVRSALHQSLVKSGMLDAKWGKLYDLLFENRQRGDYMELVIFTKEETSELLEKATEFVKILNQILMKIQLHQHPQKDQVVKSSSI